MISNANKQTKGLVILAGAGPGDPELITLKAVRFLKDADVVICDRLVSPQILDLYVNKEALILHAGKQCREGRSTPQSVINELLVEYAMQGKKVVRLKGGDTGFFSNILDELQVLAANGIKYEIIPGITAASGASAYAGLPLTARDYSNSVRFVTFYKKELIPESYWRELGKTEDTIVFYMSSDTHAILVANLLKHGIDHNKHIAVIEQATTPFQKVHCTTLGDYLDEFADRKYASPSLIIVGKVAGLHLQFSWKENSSMDQPYFKPVLDNQAAAARA